MYHIKRDGKYLCNLDKRLINMKRHFNASYISVTDALKADKKNLEKYCCEDCLKVYKEKFNK